MGFLNKIKKSFELKQNIPTSESIHQTEKKILELKNCMRLLKKCILKFQ